MTIINVLKRPLYYLIMLWGRLLPKTVENDAKYLRILYRYRTGESLNLINPSTFNEKMTWLKLYDRNPLYTKLADKYEVKEYVASRIGKKYVVENYGVYDKWEDIDFSCFPNQFVIKATHDSGGAFVCKDKKTFNFNQTRKIINRNLKINGYLKSREWSYKNIKPRIIVDRLLDDHTGKELRDYKFWCFNGNPTYVYLTIKAQNIYENFYDMTFKPIMIDHNFPRHQPEFEKPTEFEEMKSLAAKLSKDIPFVRVDFFDVEGHVYFGEFTFYDWGGTRPFRGNWDKKLGVLLELPKLNMKNEEELLNNGFTF